jgi:hypothetical protein
MDTKVEINLDPKLSKVCSPEMQGVFKSSKYMGFLKIHKKSFLKESWKEKFFLLCNIGLLVFENPGVISFTSSLLSRKASQSISSLFSDPRF